MIEKLASASNDVGCPPSSPMVCAASQLLF